VATGGNRAIERAAIDFVIEQEQRRGRTARDTRGHGAGDLESDGRIIEVKAFGGLWSSGLLYFTPPQLRQGEANANYYVYIVENVAQGDPSQFDLRVLHGDDLRRLFAGAKPHRSYVPVRAADKARLTRLIDELDPRAPDGSGAGAATRTRGPFGAIASEIGAGSVGDKAIGRTDLKSLVIAKWQESGRPRWDLARTVDATEAADEELLSRGENPAPMFRSHRTAGDDKYVRTWTWGCHFEWLNPR